jgi:hypothetical protein
MLSITVHQRYLSVLRHGLLAAFVCSSGCGRSTPSRPATVSASAVWVGNAFIECSVEAETDANRCSVRDRNGVLLDTGLFILNKDGRAATKPELRYAAFRGDRIQLENERFLYPVMPPEKDRDELDRRLALLAGHGVRTAVDCGRIAVSRDATPASECALNALMNKKPFHVRFDLQGYEGIYVFGLAGDGSENVYAVEDDSLLMDMTPVAGTRIGVTPCPKPINTRISTRGILTCLSTNP